MKTNFKTYFATSAVFITLALPGELRSDYTPNFAEPPYTSGLTVIGIEGWENRLPSEGDNSETAIVENVSLNEDKTVIALENASLKNISFPPAYGELVTLTFSVAVDFHENVPKGRHLRIWTAGTLLGEIYYEANDEGGFGYRGVGDGRSGGIICVPFEDIAENSFYTFTIDIDASTQSYSISVTGLKADGSPLAYKAEGVEFLSPGKGTVEIKGIHLLTTSKLRAYFGSLAIETR